MLKLIAHVVTACYTSSRVLTGQDAIDYYSPPCSCPHNYTFNTSAHSTDNAPRELRASQILTSQNWGYSDMWCTSLLGLLLESSQAEKPLYVSPLSLWDEYSMSICHNSPTVQPWRSIHWITCHSMTIQGKRSRNIYIITKKPNSTELWLTLSEFDWLAKVCCASSHTVRKMLFVIFPLFWYGSTWFLTSQG